MARYLADSSIWIARRRAAPSYLDDLLSERIGDGQVLTSAPIVLEVQSGAQSGQEYDQDWRRVWTQLEWLPLDDRASRRAVDVQRELAATTRGAHRRPALDYLIAACAESTDDVVLWHWDHDLRLICEHTGQPQEAEHARARQRRLAQPD